MTTRPDRPAAFYLAGFMGSGKSTVGSLLAAALGWPFVDLDNEIERRERTTISEVFAEQGEAGFRRAEREALLEQAALIRDGSRRVVALGGGTYAFPRNRDTMRETGLALWLDADADTLWERVRETTHRPLARDRAEFESLHESRRELYSLADEHIDASELPSQIVDRILRLASARER